VDEEEEEDDQEEEEEAEEEEEEAVSGVEMVVDEVEADALERGKAAVPMTFSHTSAAV